MRERIVRSILRQAFPELREPKTTRVVQAIMREARENGLPEDVADGLKSVNDKMWTLIEETRALNQRLKKEL